MENASKALLIAAAVLIIIILIALGVNLLNAGGDTIMQTGEVKNSLDESIEGMSHFVLGLLSGDTDESTGSLLGDTDKKKIENLIKVICENAGNEKIHTEVKVKKNNIELNDDNIELHLVAFYRGYNSYKDKGNTDKEKWTLDGIRSLWDNEDYKIYEINYISKSQVNIYIQNIGFSGEKL